MTLEPQANWKVLLNGVVSGDLDASHMLAGQVLAASAGIGAKTRLIAPFSLDLNGKGITLSNQVLGMVGTLPDGPVSAAVLKPVVAKFKAEGKPFKMGMVFPVSTHNYVLRYWLAAGGMDPGYYLPGDTAGLTGADVQLSVTPPPQMPATMEAGTISGYSVGEPWNQAAVAKKIGAPVIVDPDIAGTTGDKVFGMTEAFAAKNPKTVQALLRALIRASMWLDADGGKNRPEAVKLLSNSKYVGADEKVLLASMTGKFTFAGGKTVATPEFNMFFDQQASYPMYSDGIWFLTQMRRWGQIAEIQARSVVPRYGQGRLPPRPLRRRRQGAGRWRQGACRCLPEDRWVPRLFAQGHRWCCVRCPSPCRLCRRLRDRSQGRSKKSYARRRQVRGRAMTAAVLVKGDFTVSSQVEPSVDTAVVAEAASAPEPVAPKAAPFKLPIGKATFDAAWPPVVGVMSFILLWGLLAPMVETSLGALPGPLDVWHAFLGLTTEYAAARADQAATEAAGQIYTGAPTFFDQILTSLQTVGLGFVLASIAAVPLGLVAGMSKRFNAAINPLVQVMRPISPLAWLPIVTMVVSSAVSSDDPALPKSFIISAIVVMMCSLWPTLINTAIGTASIDKDLINVGRVLRLSWFQRLTKLVLPSSLPFIFTGMRLSLGGWAGWC
ncbi:ABC transporter substrate-binding protein [Novosphingobium colocasiae]